MPKHITKIQQRYYAVVHTLKDKHYQKKTLTSNEITIQEAKHTQ